MPNYGQYNLANSQRVKPFAGSVLPELTSVAGTLQERFDNALAQEDMLSRSVRSSQAAPFSQDQQLLNQLKQEFRDRMEQRSQRGDYENMLRDTMLDSRDFLDRYRPITENAARYQTYQEGLQAAVAKGDIKSPDKARKLLALSTQSYQGLQYDPTTGAYSNKFQGITPVKDIDLPEKIDKWMKDVAPTVIGKETKFTDGVWRKYSEGKWTTLTSKEIASVVEAGRRLDPEFNAWMGQEQQLAGADIANISAEDVAAMENSPLKDGIQSLMQSGYSPSDAAKALAGADRSQKIFRDMQQYANKYIRDDIETGSGVLGADEYNLQRTGKKLEDEDLVLSMPILQPETRATVSGAEDMVSKIRDAGTAVQASRQNFDNWVSANKLRPDSRGNWIDDKGNDKTLKYLEQQQVYKQAEKTWQNLQALDLEARRRTGFNMGSAKITPDMLKAAEAAGEKARKDHFEFGLPGPGQSLAQYRAEGDKIYQEAKGEALRRASPGYRQYDAALKDMTSQGAQLINVQNFNSKSANEQANTLFKNLALNLDAAGLNSGTQGLKWASGDAVGEDLSADDYKKVVADAKFAGYAMDTDGQLKFFYKVGAVKQNSKGKLVGEEGLVKMPALPGTTEILLKHKQTDLAQLALGQSINQTINQPSGQGYINIDGKNKIFVDRIDQTEIGKSEVGAGINLRFPAPNGTYTEIRVGSVGEAINSITDVLRRKIDKNNK